MRDFRQLDIWFHALAFVKRIYEISSSFPSTEKYGIISQMNRSAVSVPSNIAEGCSRRTSVEFSRFLDIALGSSFELETLIEISFQINYLSLDNHTELIKELHILQRRLNKLRSSI